MLFFEENIKGLRTRRKMVNHPGHARKSVSCIPKENKIHLNQLHILLNEMSELLMQGGMPTFSGAENGPLAVVMNATR